MKDKINVTISPVVEEAKHVSFELLDDNFTDSLLMKGEAMLQKVMAEKDYVVLEGLQARLEKIDAVFATDFDKRCENLCHIIGGQVSDNVSELGGSAELLGALPLHLQEDVEQNLSRISYNDESINI